MTTFGQRGLALILLIFICLALAYSLVLPLGEAADETDHFALVRFIAERARPPVTVEERRAIGPKGDASPTYHSLVALLSQHVDVSDLPDLPHTQRSPERFIPTDGFRANLIFHTEDEAFPFHDIVLAWHLARLASVPLGAATVVAAYLTALAVARPRAASPEGSRWFALAAAAFVAFLPRFVINSAVVNDDNLVVPLVAFAVYCLVRVAQGDERPRTLLALGVLMGLAAITKYHSLVLLPEATLVLAALAWRMGWGWRDFLRRWGWMMLAFLLAAGWWFAFLVVRFNQVAELGLVRGLMATLGDPVVTLGFGRILDLVPGGAPVSTFDWPDWASLLFRTFWISYGWLHVFATPIVYQLLGALTLLAAAGLAARVLARDKADPTQPAVRFDIAVLAFHCLVYLGVVAMRYQLRPEPETAQGRHLYPALTAIAFFFVLGLGHASRLISSHVLAGTQHAIRNSAQPPRGTQYAIRNTQYASAYRLDQALAWGLAGALLVLSILTPPLFILPVYRPYLPIVTADPQDVPIAHRIEASFAPGLEFQGYDLAQSSIEAGTAVPLSLYWHVGARQERDYLVVVCLRDGRGQVVVCRQGHPVDGRYPMRAWEDGYVIRDQVYLPTPRCLTADDYELTLSVLPLRLDTASTAVDDKVKAQLPLSLGRVALSTGQAAPTPGFDVWVGERRYVEGEIELTQMRQGLTVISYQTTAQAPGALAAQVRLLPVVVQASSLEWKPVAPEIVYRCPDGPATVVNSFVLDPATQPGRYALHVLETGFFPENPVSKPFLVTVLTHARNFTPPGDIPNPVNVEFAGEVKLLGYQADLSPRWPGDSVQMTAYWQSLRTMNRNHIVGLHLLDYTMNTWGQSDQILGSHYPNVLWAPGETVSETYPLPISPQTPAGLYTIEFSLYDYILGTFFFLPAGTAAGSEPTEHLYVGPLRIRDPAELTPPAHPLLVDLGDQFQLLGYDLSSPELSRREPLSLALHWQALEPPAGDYTVFTQLIGPDGLVWGQQDNQPQGGRYPTSQWAVREKVVDRYELALREGAPSGQYRLLVGMYELASGQRLAAIAEDGQRLADDAIQVTTLALE